MINVTSGGISRERSFLIEKIKDEGYARFEARAEILPNGWRGLTERERLALFPDVGTIFSWAPGLAECPKGTLKICRVQTNNKFKPGIRHDAYLIESHDVETPIDLILDFRGHDFERQRAWAVEEGFGALDSMTPSLALAIGPDEVIFPKLRENSGSGRFSISPDVDLAAIPVHRCKMETGQIFRIGKRSLLLPGAISHEPIRFVNWEYDQDFLKRVLKFARDNTSEGDDPSLKQMTRAVMEKIQRTLTTGESLVSHPWENEAIRERLALLQRKFAVSESLRAVVAETLMDRPEIRAELDTYTDKKKSEIGARLEVEIDQELRGSHAALISDLDGEKRKAEHLVVELEHQIGKRKEEIATLEKERDHAVARLRNDVEDLFGKFAAHARNLSEMIRLAKSTGVTFMDSLRESEPDVSPPWARALESESKRIELEELPLALKVAADGLGLDLSSFKALDVRLRAGEMAFVDGEDARLMIETYSSVACGGDVRWMPLDQSFLGLQDLWTSPGTSKLTDFASTWLEAERQQNRCFIICFVSSLDSRRMEALISSFFLITRSRPQNLFIACIDTVPFKTSSVRAFERIHVNNHSPEISLVKRWRNLNSYPSQLAPPFLVESNSGLIADILQRIPAGRRLGEVTSIANRICAARTWADAEDDIAKLVLGDESYPGMSK